MDLYGLQNTAVNRLMYPGYYGTSANRVSTTRPKDLTISENDSEAEKSFKTAINNINNGRSLDAGSKIGSDDAKTIRDAYKVLGSAMNRYGLSNALGDYGNYGRYGQYGSRSSYSALRALNNLSAYNAFNRGGSYGLGSLGLGSFSSYGALSALGGFGW